MSVNTINTTELINGNRYHASQDDVPNKTAKDMKDFFDYIPKDVIIPKVNELVNEVNTKASAADVYTKSETDTKVSEKANSADVYTITQADEKLSQKADSADVYTKAQADTKLSEKANSADVYTKEQTDALLEGKAYLSDSAVKFANALKGTASGVTVSANDVSPVEHELSLRALSKNRIDIKTAFLNSYNSQFLTNLSTDNDTVYFEKNYEGSISASVYVYAYLEPGTYTFSGIGTTDGYGNMAYIIKNPDGTQLGNTITIGQTQQEFLHYITVSQSGVYTFCLFIGYSAAKGSYVSYQNLQIEKGSSKTDYTPYVDPESIIVSKLVDGEEVQTAVPASDSTVTGIVSSYPAMEIKSNFADGSVDLELEYNRDINKAFAELWEAIAQ